MQHQLIVNQEQACPEYSQTCHMIYNMEYQIKQYLSELSLIISLFLFYVLLDWIIFNPKGFHYKSGGE